MRHTDITGQRWTVTVMGREMTRDLVEAARRGDHEAFEVLATAAADRLYAVARLILRSTDLAEDAVQEALVAAWRRLPSLRDPDRFDAWLHRLLVNACADQGRQLRRWSKQVSPLQLETSADDDTGSVADREQLERGFRRLKPEQRAVVVLHYYSGFSAAEIARIVGIPEGTARSRLHYATEALRAALEADARRPTVAQDRTA
jgi:RNA polymerase sigma-70 factor (ECF subfamily)